MAVHWGSGSETTTPWRFVAVACGLWLAPATAPLFVRAPLTETFALIYPRHLRPNTDGVCKITRGCCGGCGGYGGVSAARLPQRLFATGLINKTTCEIINFNTKQTSCAIQPKWVLVPPTYFWFCCRRRRCRRGALFIERFLDEQCGVRPKRQSDYEVKHETQWYARPMRPRDGFCQNIIPCLDLHGTRFVCHGGTFNGQHGDGANNRTLPNHV